MKRLVSAGERLSAYAIKAAGAVIGLARTRLADAVRQRSSEVVRERSSEVVREREMLAAIVEQSSDAVIASTLDGIITAWNGGAERIYGYTAGEVIGKPITDLLPDGAGPGLRLALDRLAAGEQIQQDETIRVRRDGTTFVVSVIVSPIRDAAGVVVAAAATERDVTEHLQARERSARAARLESLGQLAGGVAHDFNNLLAIIMNYADFVAEEVTGEAADDLARIRDAADRARSLTGQLLLFAKREPTQVEVVDLNDVVVQGEELLSRTIGEDIRLVCRRCDRPVPVHANRGRLDQILLNLVINARDAMPTGGVVVAETDIAQLTDPPGHWARLTVSDTGTGMTAEVRDRLFEPFFTTKPADQGTGLGLATVYGIVGDAGGHIGVESELGIGTTFRILLPVAADEAARLDDDATGEPPRPGHGERVLVVEDDEQVRDLVVRLLDSHGYRTVPVDEDDLGPREPGRRSAPGHRRGAA
ncbi:PAS domain-containing sensor histidine kinase [Actinoplanes sp. DH11]|uniref:ATP-binding response regulator n=1 Tax=Actinoplanes sp. DH11 TaxID=2857011 RepID=UPI001E31CC9F|nr:PAS domain-containing sensor histidine kinase [Actinoplanes sp. DH11]